MLPPNSQPQVVDAFVQGLLLIIQTQPGNSQLCFKINRLIFKFVRGDDQVFKRFIPNYNTVRRLQLDQLINSANMKEQDLGLDFATFILRYHRNVNYEFFGDDQVVISRIKRAETFRAWADIEDLAHVYEKLSNSFGVHQKTVNSAFKEVRDYCDQLST